MADEAAAVEGGQSFLWWLLSPLLGLGIFLIPMAVIGFFMYKLLNSLNEKERKREEKKRLKEQKKKK